MKTFSHKKTYFILAGFCALYLGAAYFLEIFKDMQPCPLCVLQRWLFIALFIIFFVAGLHVQTKLQNLYYSFTAFFIAAIGILLSGRHLWLIYHPLQELGVCAPNLSYLFKQQPFMEAVKTLFWGSGDCATITESFLGFTIPFWSLVGFLIVASFSLWQMKRNFMSK